MLDSPLTSKNVELILDGISDLAASRGRHHRHCILKGIFISDVLTMKIVAGNI